MDAAALRQQYQRSPLRSEPDRFVLYRIIGNDLPPRHRVGQSRANLEFILEHEPPLEGCEKRFIVNRIVDQQEQRAIIALLEDAGLPYLCIPFRIKDYRKAPWDFDGVPPEYAPFTKRFKYLSPERQDRIFMRLYRHKNNYALNNNGARNIALNDGRTRAKWILPWDGNCFITSQAWQETISTVLSKPERPYFVTPMVRLLDNHELLKEGLQPRADQEPQILFRQDSLLEFDPEFPYGRRPKVELLWRLGVPGPWDEWAIEPWDLPVPSYAVDSGAWLTAGWVARLFSGIQAAEAGDTHTRERMVVRGTAIRGFIERLDRCAFADEFSSDRLWLLAQRPPDKTPLTTYTSTVICTPCTSRSRHSLFGTPARRSTQHQDLFQDVATSTVKWLASNDAQYAKEAIARVNDYWRLHGTSGMEVPTKHPWFRHAWVPATHRISTMEAVNCCFFLDALKLLERSGNLPMHLAHAAMEWSDSRLLQLQSTPVGGRDHQVLGLEGLSRDLQIAALALFNNHISTAQAALRDVRFRIHHRPQTIGSLACRQKVPIHLPKLLNLSTSDEYSDPGSYLNPFHELRRAIAKDT